jgi:AAA+ ATPase superfamily predicted ATPase
MSTIIGRITELKILDKIMTADQAEFLAVYGRRRIGKTFLISQYFKDKGIYFELIGNKNASLSEQLENFTFEYSSTFGNERENKPINSWHEAFTLLRVTIEKIKTDQKIILFFDELPWLASPKSGFLAALDHFWNRYFSREKNAILIVCGSAASWMIKNIISNKGGLHGRITREIRLLPFNLAETEMYLQSRGIELDRKQIIDIYMAIGGVPKYLFYLERGKSARQLINELCFTNQGPLVKEFRRLYASLFDTSDIHIQIIRELAQKKSGLTKDELLKRIGLSSGGTSSTVIRELEESGFIAYIPTFGKPKLGGRYQLIDEYSLFYIDWIEPTPKFGLSQRDQDYWLKMMSSRQWTTWSGYAFESICLKHIHQIKIALGVTAINTTESSWLYQATQQDNNKGAQIDLVIDRADRCINLCEMKYTDSEFIVTRADADDLINKKQVFKLVTNTKKTLFTTLVTTFGSKPNEHYLRAVDSQITMDALFLE